MKLYAFAVRDQKAEAFLRPFFAETRGLALRSFGDAVNDPDHSMNRHAADYTLFQIGVFDQDTGLFVPGLESCGNAVSFMKGSALIPQGRTE